MSFDFNDHADEAARKDYPNERDCEHGQLRRSCPLCAAEADYAALLTRHNALMEAVEWERECGTVSFTDLWFDEWNRTEDQSKSAMRELRLTRRAAQAEVDRLLGDIK